MRNLQSEGPTSISAPARQVMDRSVALDQRKHAGKDKQLRWLYKPTDLVTVKHWQWGTFNATVISVQASYATVLGPMGAIQVPCSYMKLIDRYDD